MVNGNTIHSQRSTWNVVDWVWVALLGAISLGAALLIWLANRPGRMSFDSSHQLRQVLREIPLDDWHPAIMTWTWRLLFDLTDRIGTMALLQIAVALMSGLALSVILYERTRRRLVSLAGLGVLLMPHSITFLGVLWKDTQMMIAYFAATVAMIAARQLRGVTPAIRALLLMVALGFLLYGTLVRLNAFFATAPLVLLLYNTWRNDWRDAPQSNSSWLTRFRGPLASIFAFGVLAMGVSSAFNAAASPVKTSHTSLIYLDDIIFTIPAAEIARLDVPGELKAKLIDAQAECVADGHIWNAYWRCYGRGATGQPYEAIAYPDEVRSIWFREVLNRPDRWTLYHAQTFARFLTSVDAVYAGRSHSSVPPEYIGDSARANSILHDYVVDLGADTLPWLFRPWFWLVTSIALFALAPRASHLRFEIRALSSSAGLYLAGYFFYVPAINYRYSYWAAVACTLAIILLIADRYFVSSPALESQRSNAPAPSTGPKASTEQA